MRQCGNNLPPQNGVLGCVLHRVPDASQSKCTVEDQKRVAYTHFAHQWIGCPEVWLRWPYCNSLMDDSEPCNGKWMTSRYCLIVICVLRKSCSATAIPSGPQLCANAEAVFRNKMASWDAFYKECQLHHQNIVEDQTRAGHSLHALCASVNRLSRSGCSDCIVIH